MNYDTIKEMVKNNEMDKDAAKQIALVETRKAEKEYRRFVNLYTDDELVNNRKQFLELSTECNRWNILLAWLSNL